MISVFTLVAGFLAAASLGGGSSLVFFGKSLFDWFDTITATWMMPIGGLFVSWFVGWYLETKLVRAQLSNNDTTAIRFFRTYLFLLRYVAPLGIIVIFLVALLK
jgi:NSS family neurotransmitter:Na+ symporter